MDFVNEFLKHPDTVIIKSKFYPKGLTEQRVYDYWIKNKDQIIRWINNRHVSFLLNLGEDNKVLKRNISEEFIHLTSQNYEDLINGRINTIYVTQTKDTNYFVIDIDAAENIKYKEILIAMKEVKELLKNLHVIKYEHLFTSFKGLHLIAYMRRSFNIDIMREDLKNILSKQTKYKVHERGRKGGINLDLSPNYDKALHICRYSLTKDYLISDDVITSIRRAGHTI